MLNFKSNLILSMAFGVTLAHAPVEAEAQGTRDRLFNEFETSLKNLANPLVAADAMQKIGDIHRQIAQGSVTDTAALWPSLASTSATTDSPKMHQILDICADIAFGRSDAEYPGACLSPDIFAIYSERQAAQFIHFNSDVMRHPALAEALQMSVDHGSFGAVVLSGRRAIETREAVSHFSYARELAIANGNRMGRISAEAHLVQALVHDQGTKDEILAALRVAPYQKVMPFRQATRDYATVYFLCINEVLAADTEERDAKAACENFFEGGNVSPSDLEDPDKTVNMSDLTWSQSGNSWIAREEIETSGAAFTLLRFEKLSCPATYWASQYHISTRLDGVGGRGLINTTAPEANNVIELKVGDSNDIFFHNDDFVTRGFRFNQRFAIDNGDEDFAYALLDHQQRVMHGHDGERVTLTLSISVPSSDCEGKFGWTYEPTERQQSEARRLE